MKVVIIRGSSAVFLSQIQSTVKRVSRWILSPASVFPCKLSVWPLSGTALTGWMYNDLGLHPGAHLIAASVIPSSASMCHYLFCKLCLETSFSLRSVQLNSRQYLHTDYLPFYMLNSRQCLHTDYLPFYMLNSRQYLHTDYLPFYWLNSRQCLHTDYLPFYMLRKAHMHSTLSHKSFPHSVAVLCLNGKRSG